MTQTGMTQDAEIFPDAFRVFHHATPKPGVILAPDDGRLFPAFATLDATEWKIAELHSDGSVLEHNLRNFGHMYCAIYQELDDPAFLSWFLVQSPAGALATLARTAGSGISHLTGRRLRLSPTPAINRLAVERLDLPDPAARSCARSSRHNVWI